MAGGMSMSSQLIKRNGCDDGLEILCIGYLGLSWYFVVSTHGRVLRPGRNDRAPSALCRTDQIC